MGLLNNCSNTIIEHSRTEAANESADRTWRRWIIFLTRIGLSHDSYLDSIQHPNRTTIAKCFLQTLRLGAYSRPRYQQLSSKNQQPILGRSIRKASSDLAAKFRGSNRISPFNLEDSQDLIHPSINALFGAWSKIDPATSREPAITPKHLRFIFHRATESKSTFFIFQANLLIAAFFFAMRSCEYSRVEIRGLTKLLQVGNISFFDVDLKQLPKNASSLLSAEFVTITFTNQKNNHKGETRTQKRTGDPVLCPVLCWSNIILTILSDPKMNEETTVNTFPVFDETLKKFTYLYLSQKSTNKTLRDTGKMKPVRHFGYRAEDIGSHSIRSGAAMALFLADESVHKIMILGRWSSDAFLTYIRPQVQEWTSGMSTLMLSNNDFHHCPNILPQEHKNSKRKRDDPATPGDQRTFAGTQDKNSSFNGSKTSSFLLPKLHLFH